jgi:hypothetical protein
MADFTDKEDKILIRLVLQEESRNKNKISWLEIGKKMRTKKQPSQLRNRANRLKQRFGRDFAKRPKWYRSDDIQHLTNKIINKTEIQTHPLSTLAAHGAVLRIFASVKRSDIRQPSGKTEHNAGELTLESTTALVKACSLTKNDVFADIGSGIGNVIAQVALQSNVASSIGVEIRSNVAKLGERMIKEAAQQFRQLEKVKIYAKDVCNLDIQNDKWLEEITVLYCHNTLFTPESLIFIERICCQLPVLRTIVIHLPLCSRHRSGCQRYFCSIFHKRRSSLKTNVSYTASDILFQIYDRIQNV